MCASFFFPARSYVGILLLFQGAAALLAQTAVQPDFYFSRISMQDGLDNQIITSICEGSNGLIWFGTQNGLYHFDGFRTTRFTGAPNRQLPHALITDIEELKTPGGDYLLVCSQYGSRLLDADRQCIVPFSTIGLPDSLLAHCTSIEKKETGKRIALCGQALYQVEQNKSGNFTTRFWTNVPDSLLLEIAVDPTDPETAWLFPAAQYVLRVTKSAHTRLDLPKIENNPSPIPGLLGLKRTPLGLVGWDYARNLYRFNPSDNRFEVISPRLQLTDVFPALAALDRAFKQRNVLYCQTTLKTDQEILGTTLGMFFLRKRPNRFRTPESMVGSEVRGIWTDSLGNWVAGTYTGLFAGALHHNSTRRISGLQGVWAFLPLQDNQWMLACENPSGIRIWNQKTNTISAPPKPSSPSVRTISLLSACRDFRENIWAGGYYGLYWSAPDSPFYFQALYPQDSWQPVQAPYYRALLPDIDSTLWFGGENGLFRLHLQNHPKQVRVDTLLNQVFVSHLYLDKQHNIWVATKGKGIARYDRAAKQFEWFDTERGLVHNFACRIEGSDQDRALWISTHNGLSRLDVPTGIFHHYREDEGIPGNEFNSGASARFPDGTLIFGGVSGLVHFHPDSLRPGNFQHKTILTHAHLYLNQTDSVLYLGNPSETLQLPPYPRVFEVCLGITDYVRSDQARFRYRLIGASDDWILSTGENNIRFFQLAPGHYTLEVQALPFDGHQGPPVSLNILVLTPYDETWWFRALLLAGILLFAYLAYRFRLRQILKTFAIRQQIADDLHDDIGNKLNINNILLQKIKRDSSRNNAAPTEDTWNKMLETNQDTLQALRTLIWSVDPKKDRMQNVLTRMQDFTDDYLRPLNIRCVFSMPDSLPDREIRLDFRHNAIMIYQELLTNMVKHAPPKQIEISLNLASETNLTLSLTNVFNPDKIQTPYSTTSGKYGLDSIQRRLHKINGSIQVIETTKTFQTITLSFPHIFK